MTMRDQKTLDFADCETPEDAVRVLRNVAQKFEEDCSELQHAWQDRQAGIFWHKLAVRLEKLAAFAETQV
jgi:hypothetical protein